MVEKTCTRCGENSYSSSDRGEWICPTCGEDLTVRKCPVYKVNELHKDDEMNALSRKDNKTVICSDCGMAEAMEDLF